MILRDAELKDVPQLDDLLTKLIREEAQYDSNLNKECVITDNYCHRIGLDGHKLLLLEESGEILGYLYGFIYHIPGIYEAPIAILDALYIDKNHRRKGYASMLLCAFKAFAAESGVRQIELKVISTNEAASALYGKLAFRESKKYMKLEL